MRVFYVDSALSRQGARVLGLGIELAQAGGAGLIPDGKQPIARCLVPPLPD